MWEVRGLRKERWGGEKFEKRGVSCDPGRASSETACLHLKNGGYCLPTGLGLG